MDIIEPGGSNDQCVEWSSDGSSSGDDEHHGGLGRVHERGSDADGDGSGAAVGDDLGSGEFDRSRADRCVHGDGTL